MRRPLLAAGCLVLLGTLVVGQTPQPATAPASRPADPKDVLNEMLKPGAERRKPLAPVPGAPLVDKTTVNPVAPGNRPMTLKREGGYVNDRVGRVTKSADGKGFEFNFDADATAMQDPPMGLLPNLSLMMMQDQLKTTGRDLRFRVSGMVTEYMGRNYLLLSKVIVINDG